MPARNPKPLKGIHRAHHSKLHDFHLANQIVKLAQEYARQNNLKKIKKISIELGDIVEHGENIKPDNLRYNIRLLMPTQVEVKRVRGNKWRLVSIEGK